MKKNIFIAAAVIFSSQIQAQSKEQNWSDSAKKLNEVVVTATKFPTKQSQTGKVITVISKEQLNKSGGKTVSQILNEQAGITINGALNNAGSVQTVFMRGASSGRTLILIDGIPVSDPSMINNEFDLNLIAINDVDRIEICKGAQSTMYGSDAIAGVINIITTKSGVEKPFNFKASKSWGNKNTSQHNIRIYGKEKQLTYNLSYSKYKTKGFSAAYDSTRLKNFDNDGYNSNILRGLVQYQFTPELSAKTFFQFNKSNASIDNGPFIDDKDFTTTNKSILSGLGLNYKKGIVNINANYEYGKYQRNFLDDSLDRPTSTYYSNNNYGSRTQFLELFANISAAKWMNIVVGTDYRWNTMSQKYYSINSYFGPYSSSFNDSVISQTSFYSSLLFNSLDKKFNLEIGGRINNNSKYGNNTTFTFNPSYTIDDNWRIFGSVASGFKAPSIFQVYDAYSGNPKLQPEKSINYEIGIQQNHSKLNNRLVYFYRDINNGIDYNYVNYQYYNFVKQVVSGLELELKYMPVRDLNLSANYTYLNGTEQTESRKSFGDTTYNYLLRRPKNSLNLAAAYNFSSHFSMSINGKYVNNRYDVGGYKKADVLLNSYFLLGAYAEYKIKKERKIFVNLQNIGNVKFFDVRGYNAIPFLITAGLTYNL